MTPPPMLVTAALALSTTLVGCDLVSPTTATDLPMPRAASAGAARTDGAFVFHGRVPGALLMVNFDRERTLIVGHTADQAPRALCHRGAAGGGHEHLFTPNGVLHLLVRAEALPAVVWSELHGDHRHPRHRTLLEEPETW